MSPAIPVYMHGYPLSLLLFNIILEQLAISVRNNGKIKIIIRSVEGDEIKTFVSKKISHLFVFDTLKLFSAYTRLRRVNND